jgi:hypothetical protein
MTQDIQAVGGSTNGAPELVTELDEDTPKAPESRRMTGAARAAAADEGGAAPDDPPPLVTAAQRLEVARDAKAQVLAEYLKAGAERRRELEAQLKAAADSLRETTAALAEHDAEFGGEADPALAKDAALFEKALARAAKAKASASAAKAAKAPAKAHATAPLVKTKGAKGKGPKRATRLPRRSLEEIKQTLSEVVKLVGKGRGLRAEEIRTAMNLDLREVPRVLKEGLATKVLKAKGQKRATTYTAV